MPPPSNRSLPYFKQWDYLDCDVAEWQNEPDRVCNEGRGVACQIIGYAGTSVLDVGCGICLDYPRLRHLEYYALDVARKFLDEAKRHHALMAINASALQLPLATDGVDTVYCKDLLVHMPPDCWKPLLAEMFRVARRLVLTLESQWYHHMHYVKAETYQAQVRGEAVELQFYNNAYSLDEVSRFAFSRGVRSMNGLHGGADNWQITLYQL